MGPGLNKLLWVLVLGAVVEVESVLTVIPSYYPLASKLVASSSDSNNGGGFTSQTFIHGMHQLGITLTPAPSYQPQSNGVGLMKTAVRRLLMCANLADRYVRVM
eukprot:6072373-Amphidinium_carterae.2